MGDGKVEAPALQATIAGSLGALPDRAPLQKRPTVPVGVELPAPVRMLTG